MSLTSSKALNSQIIVSLKRELEDYHISVRGRGRQRTNNHALHAIDGNFALIQKLGSMDLTTRNKTNQWNFARKFLDCSDAMACSSEKVIDKPFSNIQAESTRRENLTTDINRQRTRW